MAASTDAPRAQPVLHRVGGTALVLRPPVTIPHRVRDIRGRAHRADHLPVLVGRVALAQRRRGVGARADTPRTATNVCVHIAEGAALRQGGSAGAGAG